MAIDDATTQDLESAVKKIISSFDPDPDREGLRDTPKRYIRFLKQFMNTERFNLTTFSSEGYDEIIVVKDIPFFSLCEHHLAPFFGTGAIAYIPNEKIVGLSKLPRMLDHYSHRFQNQERITYQVADSLNKTIDPKGVAVILKARHLCIEMRGVKKHDVFTTTSKLFGVFKDSEIARNEVLKLMI